MRTRLRGGLIVLALSALLFLPWIGKSALFDRDYAGRTVTRLDSPRKVARLASARPGFALVAREDDLPLLLREIDRPDVSVDVERGFCEDKGPLGLVLLRRRPADARSHS